MDRRSFVASLVGVAGSVALSGCRSSHQSAEPAGSGAARTSATGGSVSESVPTKVVVGKGDTWSVTLGDGDVLQNVLVDISAPGARHDILARGNGWTIRNVSVRGHLDVAEKHSPIRVQVTDPGATGRIETVYLGDGGTRGQTGIFVLNDHAGTLEIRRVNVQHWADNGIYASAPGNVSPHPYPGANGSVRVYDSFAGRNKTADFRLGSRGSFCRNCVSVCTEARSFWGYWNPWTVGFVDCDAADVPVGFRSGTTFWHGEREAPHGSPGVRLVNCRFSGETATLEKPCPLNGTPDSDPRTEPPEGVPTSPAEALDGDP